jgi:hypothetical protein
MSEPVHQLLGGGSMAARAMVAPHPQGEAVGSRTSPAVVAQRVLGAPMASAWCGWRGLRGSGVPGVGGHTSGEGGGVSADEPEQCRASGGLPGQPEEAEAGHVGDAGLLPDLPAVDDSRHVQPRVVTAVAGGPYDRVDFGGASVGEGGGAAGESASRGRKSIPRRRRVLVRLPMTRSPRARSRRAMRPCDGTVRNPDRVSQKNRSRPRTRWGSWAGREPTATVTDLVAASSAAICRPELAAPTTSTRPGGSWFGLR